jgi:hypothetical protein
MRSCTSPTSWKKRAMRRTLKVAAPATAGATAAAAAAADVRAADVVATGTADVGGGMSVLARLLRKARGRKLRPMAMRATKVLRRLRVKARRTR